MSDVIKRLRKLEEVCKKEYDDALQEADDLRSTYDELRKKATEKWLGWMDVKDEIDKLEEGK